MIPLRPLGDRIFVRPEKNPETSESGLLHLVEHRKPATAGTVIAIGDGKQDVRACPHCDGDVLVREGPRVQVGDYVVFSWRAGQEVSIDEHDTILIMRQSDILAVLE